jgi:hypothetical protein
MSWKVKTNSSKKQEELLTAVLCRVYKKQYLDYHINYYPKRMKVKKNREMKRERELTGSDFSLIGTKDPEYLQLEKVFNDFSKLVDLLAKDATIFRDSIAGKEKNRCETPKQMPKLKKKN